MAPLTPPQSYSGTFRTDAAATGIYSETTGIIRQLPLAVAQPSDLSDLEALVAWARRERLSIIPRGNGTGMAGAATGPGVILDLYNLRAAPRHRPAANLVRVSPATTVRELNAALERSGAWFPVEPSSAHIASLGGMIATNAAGARSLRYGAMRPWVHALACVFADGTLATVRRGAPLPANPTLDRWSAIAPALRESAARIPRRRTRKDSSGYGIHDFASSGELIDLLVGSEGTLAVFTGAELSVTERPPSTCTVRAAWDSLDASVHGARIAREANAQACELLDRTFLDVARRGGVLALPPSTEALLIIELAGGDLAPQAHALARALTAAGATETAVALTADEESALWEVRHAASATLARLEPDTKSLQLIEDGCVPPERLADYVRGVRNALDSCGLRGVIFGHAGDAHLHVNVLLNPDSAGWKAQLRELFERVMNLTAALGGTPSGEHGDGRLRTPELHRFWPREALQLFVQIKHAFDPEALFNPGVKVGNETLPVWDAIKYDPELPPLAQPARDGLRALERSRAFTTDRLTLIEKGG